jgi:hypothetical protein
MKVSVAVYRKTLVLEPNRIRKTTAAFVQTCVMALLIGFFFGACIAVPSWDFSSIKWVISRE